MTDLTEPSLRDRTLAGMPDRMSRRPSLRSRLDLRGRPAPYRLLAVLWMVDRPRPCPKSSIISRIAPDIYRYRELNEPEATESWSLPRLR